MSEPVAVLVVDDHPVFREGFAALLANIDEVFVVGTAASGVEALAAVRAGARGYLLKGAEPAEVVRAITTVAAGGVVFGALANRIADFFAAAPQQQSSSPFPSLTAREPEVLDLVSAGLSNGQIAARLYLSQKMVRNHVHAGLGRG